MNDTVDLIEDFELLLMLIESSHRRWDAMSARRARSAKLGTTQRDLEGLATRNLLAVKIGNEVRYRFDPGTHEQKLRTPRRRPTGSNIGA